MKSDLAWILKLIDECSGREQRAVFSHLRERLGVHPLETEWGLSAETILSAISRASDLTLRGIRGIIAEATFGDLVLPMLADVWEIHPIVGDRPFGFFLRARRGERELRVQVKLQRKERAIPKKASKSFRGLLTNPPETLYIAEVQRTRTGKRAPSASRSRGNSGKERRIETRPYRFGEFDVIAVNMHPSTKDWSRFMYTVADWLLPRDEPQQEQIRVLQPVSSTRDDYWTDNVKECIDWFLSKEQRRLYDR